MSASTSTSNKNNSNNNNKKRKADSDSTSSVSKKSATSDAAENGTKNGLIFEPYSLEDIRGKIQSLCKRVPEIPEDQFVAAADIKNGNFDETVVREWAATLQAVLEEFNLLVCCVATATYKWGTDRSGASDQNLSLLSGELGSSQEQIASTVTPRLTNVLAPVVDLVIEKTVTTKNEKTGVEVKENHFVRKLVDPDFVRLCHTILARNAPLLKQVVLSNFHKLLNCLKDYLKAQTNDTQHSRGSLY
jgi:hypothetical protein